MALRTLTYDDKSTGRKVIAFPPELLFSKHLDEFRKISDAGVDKDPLKIIAEIESIYDRQKSLANYISVSKNPSQEILRVARMALDGDDGGVRLLYTLFLAIPAKERFIAKTIGFRSTVRVMQKIRMKEEAGVELLENEKWFKQKVSMLSISHPLPESGNASSESPWLSWSAGVRRAMADPDDKWDEAILKRAMNELEAEDFRIRSMVTSIDPEIRRKLYISIGARIEEIKWKKQILTETAGQAGSATLFLQRMLGDRWNSVVEELRKSTVGSILGDMFETQKERTHTYPQIRNGTSVISGLLRHPALQRSTKSPDIVSCLQVFISSTYDGRLDLMLPPGKKMIGITDFNGFTMQDRMLSIELSRINSSLFTGDDDLPLEVDWADVNRNRELSYKSLVMSYIDNDSFLSQLLNNKKATSKIGIVDLIAERCRSLRILEMVANRRDLYTGFSNKSVPLHLIMNPSKIPLTTLRKFIHVRYVDKMTLVKISQRGKGRLREEVRREIERHLTSSS